MNRDNEESRPTVAVVAVHGVADQEPSTSARTVADLLVRLGGERYTSFVEEPRTLPTEPAPVAVAPAAPEPAPGPVLTLARRLLGRRAAAALGRFAARFEERPDLVRRRAELAARRPGLGPVDEPDLLFMRDQLADYRSDGEPYRTVRLAGSRVAGGAVAERVHVYEVHWADLSRASTGALRLLGELYQLILHLPNLGRQTLDMAELAHPGRRAWRWYSRLHRWAVRVFTLLLPVLAVLSAAVLLVPLPGGVIPGDGTWGRGGTWDLAKGGLAVAVLALLAAVATGYLTRRLAARKRTVPVFLVAPWVAAALAALLGWGLLFEPAAERSLLSAYQLLAAEGCGVALALVVFVFAAYDRLRPGALWTALVFALPTFAVFLLLAFSPGFRHGEALVDVSLWLFEVLLVITLLVSVAVYLLALAAAAFGAWLRWRARGGDEVERVRRLNWTVRGTLALSVSLFLVVNLTFGSILNGTAGRFLPGAEDPFDVTVVAPASLTLATGVVAVPAPGHVHRPAPVLPPQLRLAEAAAPAKFLNQLLTKAATSGFLIILGLLALLALTLLSGLLPVVLAEIRPPRVGWGRGLEGEAWRRARQRRDDWAEEMGRSLSTVFPWVGRLVTVLFVCLVAVMPLVSLVDLAVGGSFGEPLTTVLRRANYTVLVTTGSVVGAVVMGLFLGGRLNALALGFRPFLDVALDVDNYLRQVPRRRTPRARMVERYTSLLHYLHRWRDPDGNPYRAVVLVAHSQGTVLSADVLAYLARERAPALGFAAGGRRDDAPPLYLFTMGSPLRQLYALCFPYLYGWVDDAGLATVGAGVAAPGERVAAPGEPDGDRQVGHALPEDAAPDPAWLGLRRWVNAYRSGDYVGRALWRTPARWPHLYRASDPQAADGVVYTVSEDAAGRRREVCIGPGAHTHYWNATAPAIARELDLLISEAARGA